MIETHKKTGWLGCLMKFFGVLMLAMIGLEVIYVNFSVNDVQTKTSPFYKCNRSVETKVVVGKFSDTSYLSHQNVRKQVLRQYCAGKLKHGDSRNTNFMIYSSNARLLYCFIPKAACTTWKRLFQVMDNNISLPDAMKVEKNAVHNLKYSKFKPVDSRQKDFMERSFYTFMITRHPFERLVSTYRNKLADPYTPYFQNIYGSRILRRFRKGLTEAQYKTGAGVRFEEFLKYIIETKTFDEHWERMTRLCHPCYYKYDYLAKMETLVPDSEQILKNARLDYKFPENSKDRYKQQASALMLKYYSNITRSDLTKLYAIYKEDFEAFNYKLPQFINDKIM